MIHVTTGNKLDVIYDYILEDGKYKQKLLGLKPWNGETIIPLSDPRALVSVLESVLNEIEMRNK